MLMKRSRDQQADDITNMANSLLLLSTGSSPSSFEYLQATTTTNHRMFTCKTCNRQFSSFQALGGHRASHKKPKIDDESKPQQPSSPPKPKTHECSICGLEFAIGQALGGHMRRHRQANNVVDEKVMVPSLSLSPPQDHRVSVVKKANGRRVLCLDLNLTPLENQFVFGKVSSLIC